MFVLFHTIDLIIALLGLLICVRAVWLWFRVYRFLNTLVGSYMWLLLVDTVFAITYFVSSVWSLNEGAARARGEQQGFGACFRL
jgi:hypothetical protein